MSNIAYTSMIAKERVRNKSICVRDGCEIRNMKYYDDMNCDCLVYVSNIGHSNEDIEFIEKGEACRVTYVYVLPKQMF